MNNNVSLTPEGFGMVMDALFDLNRMLEGERRINDPFTREAATKVGQKLYDLGGDHLLNLVVDSLVTRQGRGANSLTMVWEKTVSRPYYGRGGGAPGSPLRY